MQDISKLTNEQKVQLVENRWSESASLWEVVSRSFDKNFKYWANDPDWLSTVPTRRSKARANKIFLATESVISNVLGKPSRPNVISGQDTDEAKQLSEDLQDWFLEKYRLLDTKEKMRCALRYLFMSRLLALKVYWDNETDDFDVRTVDPKTVRFSKNATSMFDTEFAIEFIPEKPILELIGMFPNKEEEILKKTGFKKEQILIDNPTTSYKEAWLGEEVVYCMNDLFLHSEPHPYWDFDGVPLTPNEMAKFKNASALDKKLIIRRAEKFKDRRKGKYESYLYNHFDKAIPPYVFASMLRIKQAPIGESSIIEQVIPLQNEIDKRKRQISDNAEQMGGIVKVDTNFVTISKADAQAMKSEPRALWYGAGVREGVTIETGKELPSFVKDDLNHSTMELDNIFGTQPTFRGEGGGQETATGRAILREQSFQRLDELINVVDTVHQQLYAWWLQMMKVKYDESHMVKVLGQERAVRVITFTRNDLLQGVEVRVVPGQVLPEDKLFKSERAKEEMIAKIIDPLTYFEETHRENPQKLAKRLLMFQINPFSIVKLDEEDMRAIQEAMALMGQLQPQQGQQDPRAQQVAEVRQRAEKLMNDPEFQKLPPEQRRQAMAQMREQLAGVVG